ncbi:hypothetical protein EK904_002526 [Melospiza melodia maxima]|nr:hypothetical protein EK904_002526 [Melospiza melodia maxima]
MLVNRKKTKAEIPQMHSYRKRQQGHKMRVVRGVMVQPVLPDPSSYK